MHDSAAKQIVYEFDGFVLSVRRRSLVCNGARVSLTPRVLDLLIKLIDNAGSVVSKEELLNSVWAGANVEEGNVNRTVSTLRQKLGTQPDGSDYIATIPRQGYSFIAPVNTSPDAETSGTGSLTQSEEKTADSSGRTWVISAIVLFVTVFAVFSAWYFSIWPKSRSLPPPKNVLLRLTDSPSIERMPVFTTTGKIRFYRYVGNDAFSFVMNDDGSNIQRDVSIAGLQFGKWSPDEKLVFFKKESDKENTFLANADGSGEVRLPFRPGNAVWSPDGRNIVYQEGIPAQDGTKQSDIFTYSLETGTIVPLVEGPSFDADPSMAPDGKSILFTSNRDGNFEIYSKEIASGEVRRLTNTPAHDSFPTYSPDGTQILFNSDREKENTDVYLMNADGSGVRKLTDLPGSEGAATNAWSPDGTRILVLSGKGGYDNIYQIYVEPLEPKLVTGTGPNAIHPAVSPNGEQVAFYVRTSDRSGTIRIVEKKTGQSRDIIAVSANDTVPTFSHDGKRVLYSEFVNGNTDIFSVNIDGTAKTNLTNDPATDMVPSISPDGKKITFATNRGGDLQRFEIYTMNADGSEQKLAFRDAGSSLSPSWSTDSKRIIFSNDREGGRNGNFELFAVNADGGEPVRLTNRPKYDVGGVYSPAGDRIAFSSNSDGNFEIYVMKADGTSLLRITRDTADDVDPQWTPDGKHIVFASNRSGTFTIYEVEV